MKIKIQCKSLLLEKTLKILLKKYIVNSNYNILISDYTINNPKLFLINNTKNTNLVKPFTKDSLLERLNNFQTIKDEHIESQMYSLLEEYTHKLIELNKKKYA